MEPEEQAWITRLSRVDISQEWADILKWAETQYETLERMILSNNMTEAAMRYTLGQMSMLKSLMALPQTMRIILEHNLETHGGR